VELISHPALAELHPTYGHPESTERLEALLLAFPEAREARPATEDDVQRCHSLRVLELLRSLDRPAYIEPNTVASQTSAEAALLAAGCAIEAARTEGFALVRPPGHHATPVASFGFCLLNNIAIAARAVQAAGEARRIAIVDFDVHHGNGTQDIFWDDDSVFYASLHQQHIFPGSGGPNEQAATTVNVPLPQAGRCGVARRVRRADRTKGPRVRSGARARLRRLRRARGRGPLPGRHARDRRRIPRAGAPLPRARAARGSGAGGRLQRRALPRLVSAALDGFSRK
jgi:hypothetical protein